MRRGVLDADNRLLTEVIALLRIQGLGRVLGAPYRGLSFHALFAHAEHGRKRRCDQTMI